MRVQKLKVKSSNNSYSIIIGKNALRFLSKEINYVCPKTKKIGLIIDKKVPKKFKELIKKKLSKYKVFIFYFNANEKTKSFNFVNYYLNKLLLNNFNRSDLIISIGGGITGDFSGFIASIFKRGINFINIPSTLLAQVDSAIGGKTGVNSLFGKNLIGSFYQPKLVISDTNFLNSLPKKEMVCGYAEILKHSLIKDKIFFNWLKKNSKNILLKKDKELSYAIKKSCLIKLYFIKKDVNEKNLRMILNFGHTFAHAMEVKSKYSKLISHGEAVLAGMMLETKLSQVKKVCSKKTLIEIENIFNENKLSYTYKKFSNQNDLKKLIPYLKNDKKNNDEKINFILIKRIGKTALPDKNKISITELKKLSKYITR